ncbi:DEAD/DEAH box helicase [Polaromonas glacialis]|uniref:DEAD/DEAH box helicase n=1 Tax=Polaromonas glacialis TaxID=866564 RepID=UPI000496004E|nr:DEAD/DEAH box helicase [Polaromonas glacialis]
MVDFKKRLAGQHLTRITDPIKLYETLDRAHDKGPLRPSQESVLTAWNDGGRAAKDVIVKLHTGQGKTLVGLLMLQARLNEGKGPAVYLCPNNFLIDQTAEQAKQFGVATCLADPDLPEAFLNSERILITSVQKLFNGLTKFGLNRRSTSVGTLLMDDAHACADAIRESCQIRIPNSDPAYLAIRTLFAAELEQQGIGTYADILNAKREALLPVPYWAWLDRETDIAAILSAASDRNSVKFAWPLLRNMLRHCQCVVSGTAIEIEPHIAPLQAFGSYWECPHRIFMSATVTDDAFLIKGLQLPPKTILEPLVYEKERWSGEKMVLLPSLIDESLDRSKLVAYFAPVNPKRRSGVVALGTSFLRTGDWKLHGAKVADTDSVWKDIAALKAGKYDTSLMLVNRYDGIDLPDDSCRILMFDGKPFSESLLDLYQEACRPDSNATLMRAVRTVEQGMGRSVRGEKDYSAIVVLGADLARLLRDHHSRSYLSSQMATQIEIGMEIAAMAKSEIEDGVEPLAAFLALIGQCLNRDDGWKAFYSEQMENVKPKGSNREILDLYSAELEAEELYNCGDYAKAAARLQTLLDQAKTMTTDDVGWYLQMMARFNYPGNRAESQRLQLAAHNKNRMLMRPPQGMIVARLNGISQGRVERIAEWIAQHGDYAQLDVALSDVLGRLVFGVKADKFERALDELSRALGYVGERPDKEWKEGPDNIWALDATNFIVWESKNEVDLDRAEISKYETDQMNSSAAWFEKHYPGTTPKYIVVHPASVVSSASAFRFPVGIMREKELTRFVRVIRGFFKSFQAIDFNDLSLTHIQNLLFQHSLDTDNLMSVDAFVKKPRDLKA